jgi:hypothetical protein
MLGSSRISTSRGSGMGLFFHTRALAMRITALLIKSFVWCSSEVVTRAGAAGDAERGFSCAEGCCWSVERG